MPEFLTPTTELEAVNAILASVGESPVDALDGEFVDAEIARNLLTQESRATQTEGYTFNTEADYPLSPDIDGRIFLPQNTLSFLFEDTSLVQRGNRVYDRVNRRYDGFATAITATLVLALNFDELPESLRRFLYIRAGRRFQDRLQSDDVLHRFQERDEIGAWAAFQNYVAAQGRFNVLSNSPLVSRLKANR
jgi:hypothetical protein